MKNYVHVFAPATIANLNCGFDILGLALNEPGDEVKIRLVDKPGVHLTSIKGDHGLLPIEPDKNTVTASIQLVLDFLGMNTIGIEVELEKKMPIGSGMGSSAASTIAGLFGINELLDNPLTKEQLLVFAQKGEELACGSGHADNIAPSLFGGITLIRSYNPIEIIKLPVPESLYCSVVFPHVEVPTRDARKMIRSKIELKDAVVQWGNVAGLVSGFFMEDYALIGRSLQDVLIEPVRAILIPEFYQMREIAIEKKAIGFGISGSGPSVFAFSTSKEDAEEITKSLQQHLNSNNIGSNGYVSKVNSQGPKLIEFR